VFTLALGIKWQCDVNMQINSDFKEMFSSGLRKQLKINWWTKPIMFQAPQFGEHVSSSIIHGKWSQTCFYEHTARGSYESQPSLMKAQQIRVKVSSCSNRIFKSSFSMYSVSSHSDFVGTEYRVQHKNINLFLGSCFPVSSAIVFPMSSNLYIIHSMSFFPI
jgi:hypothetical protein